MPIAKDEALQVFMPVFASALHRMETEGRSFVYYTSVDTALRIIGGRTIWMRNARRMNDVADVQHGIVAVDQFFQSKPNRARLYHVLGMQVGSRIDALWLHYRNHLMGEVYITCVSEHPRSEDDYGRLSMWRAYCASPDGVALVLNPAPFYLETNELNAYSSPVYYGHAHELHDRFHEVLDNIERERKPDWTDEEVLGHLVMAILFGAVCLKHPGFQEEQEWRVVHMPNAFRRPSRLRRLDNMLDPPQTVFEIPLISDPSVGLTGLSPGELIERVIIGPSNRTSATSASLIAALAAQGVLDPASRIVTSGIPLRPYGP